MQHLLPLKGLAILMIMAFHLCGRLFEGEPYWVLVLSYQGVHIFFLLSGLGLSYSLLTKIDSGAERINWLSWYQRRAVNILPLYWLVLVFTAAVFYLEYDFFKVGLDRSQVDLSLVYHFFTHLFFIHIYFDDTFYSLNPAWWFLGVIVHFYLLYPFLFLLLRSPRIRTILTLCLIGFYLFNRQSPFLNQQILFSFCLFYLGSLLPFYDIHKIHSALLRHRQVWLLCSFSAFVYFLLTVAGIFPKVFKLFTNDLLSITAIIFCYCLFLFFSQESDNQDALVSWKSLLDRLRTPLLKGMNLIGNISYAMFLIHWGFIQPIFQVFDGRPLAMVFYFLSMIFISYALTQGSLFFQRTLIR